MPVGNITPLWRRGLLLAAVLGLVLAGCQSLTMSFKKPELTVESIHWRSGNLTSQKLEIELKVQNDNAIALPVEHLEFVLNLDNLRVGQGSVDQSITVPAHGNSVVPVEMTIDLSQIFLKVLPKLKEGATPLHYQAKGQLNTHLVGRRTIPFDVSGDWSPNR